MRTSSLIALAAAACLGLGAPDAFAQRPRPPARRQPIGVTIAVDGAYRSGPPSTTDSGDFTAYLEHATYTATSTFKGGPAADVGVGVSVWRRRLSIAVGGSTFSRRAAADVTARIPHPFFFNQIRTVDGAQSVRHQETAIRVDAVWTTAINRRLDLAVSAGPTMFRVRRDVITGVEYDDVYPFDTVTFTGGTVSRQSVSVVGFNAGVDVTCHLTRYLGVGGMVRIGRGTVQLTEAGGQAIDLSVGGLEVGGGIRIGF